MGIIKLIDAVNTVSMVLVSIQLKYSFPLWLISTLKAKNYYDKW